MILTTVAIVVSYIKPESNVGMPVKGLLDKADVDLGKASIIDICLWT